MLDGPGRKTTRELGRSSFTMQAISRWQCGQLRHGFFTKLLVVTVFSVVSVVAVASVAAVVSVVAGAFEPLGANSVHCSK